MSIKIKILELSPNCMPRQIDKGDWIDLCSACDITLDPKSNSVCYIPLGVAIKLPEGYEAIVASRSSSPKNFGTDACSGIGIIDNKYCGPKDEWCFICRPRKKITINAGDRVCQFRVQLSQKATFWQKLKWLFSSGIKLEQVTSLESENRGGFGTTGTN